MKQRLIVSRSIYFPGMGLCPECGVCKLPIRGVIDLHEALITRADIAGNSQWELIFTPLNTVVRHHICPTGDYHTAGHGGDEIFGRCAKQIVCFEGYNAVRLWLEQMRQVIPQAALKAICRLEALELT